MTKLNWGMIGGGEGSQIGPAHRLGAAVDGDFVFDAGALDHRPDAGRDYGQRLGLAADRFPNEDKLMLHFNNLVKEHIGLQHARFIRSNVYAVAESQVLLRDATDLGGVGLEPVNVTERTEQPSVEGRPLVHALRQ